MPIVSVRFPVNSSVFKISVCGLPERLAVSPDGAGVSFASLTQYSKAHSHRAVKGLFNYLVSSILSLRGRPRFL